LFKGQRYRSVGISGGEKMKPKVLKIMSLVLTLVILATMLVFTSPLSAAMNPVWAWGNKPLVN